MHEPLIQPNKVFALDGQFQIERQIVQLRAWVEKVEGKNHD